MIAEIAAEEIDGWPQEVEFEAARAMQRITLRAILRAVFGAEGAQLQTLEELIPQWTALGSRVSLSPELRRNLGPWAPWPQVPEAAQAHRRGARRADRARQGRPRAGSSRGRARADGAGTPRGRHPDEQRRALRRARDDAGGRSRDDLQHAQLGDGAATPPPADRRAARSGGGRGRQGAARGHDPRGAALATGDRVRRALHAQAVRARRLSAARAARASCSPPASRTTTRQLFPHPDRFQPDRFLDTLPDTYSWIPFGGGIRRCIGATFAHMEMDVVLRVLLERVELLPTDAPARAMGVSWRRLGARRGRADDGAPTRGHLRLGRE